MYVKTTLYVLIIGVVAVVSAQAQTTTAPNLLVGTNPGPANSPPTQQRPTGNGMVQGNLLVGSNAWPAAYGAGGSDAFLMGNTWFYNQLIVTGGNTNIPAWSVNNRTDGSGNLGLVFSPGWALSKSTVFQTTGDVTFPQRVSIGNVACQTQTACTGPAGH